MGENSAIMFSITLTSVFIFIGVAILLCGVYARKRFKNKCRSCSMAVNAKVTRLNYIDQMRINYSSDEMSTGYYLPTFRYYIGEEWYEVESSLGNGNPDYKVGDVIKIWVNPYNPTEIFVPVDSGLMYYTLFLIGTLFIVMSVFVFILIMVIV